MNSIIDVTDNFEEFISSGVCVIDFWATWCGPCKMLAPIMEEVASKLTSVKFGKVDVDLAPQLAQQYEIMAIPNVCIFVDGKLADRVIGLSDEEELTEVITKYVK